MQTWELVVNGKNRLTSKTAREMYGSPQPLSDIDLKNLARRLLFRGLDSLSIARVCSTALMRKLPAGTVLFSESDEPTQVHFIINGLVKLAQVGERGSRFVLTYRSAGSLLGCFAVFGSRPHAYTAVAATEIAFLTWTAAAFESCMRQLPAISCNAMMIVAEDAHEAFQRVREFANEQVEQRIAHTVLRVGTMVLSDGKGGPNDWLPLSRQDIAEMSGATLFTVSRIMTAWERLGILQSGRQRFKLVDRERLAKIAEEKTPACASQALVSMVGN